MSPGSGTQQNSSCILNGVGSSASATGMVLTLNLALTFQPALAGSTNIYMQAANGFAATGWQLEGSWTVPGMTLTQISPNSTGSLASYLQATTEIFFSGWQNPTGTGCLGLTYTEIGDANVAAYFSTAMLESTDSGNENDWSVAPYSERANDSVAIEQLIPYNVSFDPTAANAYTIPDDWPFLAEVTIRLTTPVETLGFEAEPYLSGGTITATFYGETSPPLTITSANLSGFTSRIFAATGDLITKVSISSTGPLALVVTALRYALPGSATSPGAVATPITASTTTANTASSLTPAITSPAPGSTLPGSTATFQWSPGIGVSEYWFYLSDVTAGGKELYSGSQGLSTTMTFAGLPINGSVVYARLWWKLGGIWRYLDSSFTAASPAPVTVVGIIRPVNGASLPGSTATFQWSPGIVVSEYWLYLSNVAAGGKELYSSSQGLSTAMTFTGLPTNGRAIYARLWWRIGAGWQYSDYRYTSAMQP
jgi:hypothetical protein